MSSNVATSVVWRREVRLAVENVALDGELARPEEASGLVVFAHGSGSGRFSPRNRAVAGVLQEAGLATLLFDLLTAAEEEADERRRDLPFDIERLARRLVGVTRAAEARPDLEGLPIGYFGASTGAAAALVAAAALGGGIRAVVSRGGRPDLAGDALVRVVSPTLLVVGSRDVDVLALNREAYGRLSCEKELRVIPGATHLFPEPGALEAVARLATSWFRSYLA